MLKPLIKLLRTKQWIKNSFVFIAPFFGGKITDITIWLPLVYAFIVMCMASSAVYCLNDVLDCKSDREDPVKRKRPVASGDVTPTIALLMSGVLTIMSLTMSVLLMNIEALTIVGLYIAINILYCFWLKHVALIDIMIIALGFELRLIIGGVVASVELSMWVVIMIFLLSFFLGMAKRRDEVVLFDKKLKKTSRRSVRNYNKTFIDVCMSVLAAVMLIAYIIYTIQSEVIARFGTDKLYITSLFVLYGLLRYFQISIVEEDSGSPTKIIYSDRPLQFAVIGWLMSFILIIYG